MKQQILTFIFFQTVSSVCLPKDKFESEFKPHFGKAGFKEIVVEENLLGAGTYGKVFNVNWKGKPAALKLNYIHNEETIPLYENEEKFLTTLNNVPGIVKLHGCARYKNFFLFVFEKLNVDLEKAKKDFQKLSLARRINFYKQIAFTLAEMQKKGIIHNDFKPENVMSKDLDFKSPKIIDLGVSCNLKDQNSTPCPEGSPVYNAPEKINALKNNEKFFASDKLDPWAFLLTITEIEIIPSPYFNNFNAGISSSCFFEAFTEECFHKLVENIYKAFSYENLSLMRFVLSNLQFDPKMRKSMWSLGRELAKMETEEPSYDPKEVPAEDFTRDPKYQKDEGEDEGFWAKFKSFIPFLGRKEII